MKHFCLFTIILILIALFIITCDFSEPLSDSGDNWEQTQKGKPTPKPTAIPTDDPVPTETPAPTASTIPDNDWLHVQGVNIRDMQNNIARLTGINWFGFETSNRILHGIWEINLEAGLDQIAALGFNFLRVPLFVCPAGE